MEWLPDVCSQLHGEMVSIYWLMILPLIVFLIVLEMFKTKSAEPDAGKILIRAVASILMLAIPPVVGKSQSELFCVKLLA